MLAIWRDRHEKTVTARDAARLIRDHGAEAFSAAGEMSWREDAGLMASRSPGHWHRVQQEIGRRLSGPPRPEPRIQGYEHGWSEAGYMSQTAG